MQYPKEGLYKNITLNDLQLAAAYYPILVELAKNKHCLTYGELVDQAKEKYPELDYVQNAIAVSTGRKLDVVRLFTSERDLPDVTSLIINKGRGECGSGFTVHFDPELAREKVYSFNWVGVTTEFDVYIDTAERKVAPRKRRTRAESLKLVSAFYKANKNSYPTSIKNLREEIIILLMEGFSEKEAFDQVVEDS